MFLVVIRALFLFLPAMVANMMPVIFDKLHWMKAIAVPIDVRRFGDHKTYRGILAGLIGGALVGFLQFLLYQFDPASRWLYLFSYDPSFALNWGALLGLGALIGDLWKSLIKRHLKIAPGAPFIPFDQMDFVVGALIAGTLVYVPPGEFIVALLLVTPLLHLIVNVIAYTFGWKKMWW